MGNPLGLGRLVGLLDGLGPEGELPPDRLQLTFKLLLSATRRTGLSLLPYL